MKRIVITSLTSFVLVLSSFFFIKTRLTLTSHAQSDGWSFEERIIDNSPLASNRINDIAVADFDADGLKDVWISGRNGTGPQSAWYKNPGSITGSWTRYPINNGSWKYGDAGNVIGDSRPDIVADGDGSGTADDVHILRNDGTPTNTPWPTTTLGNGGDPDQIIIANLAGDANNDIVVMYKNGPIYLHTGPNFGRTTVASGLSGYAGGSVGDVDNDGDLDIVFGDRWFTNPGWSSHKIDGSANFPTEARSAVADINNDGSNDIVLTGEESAAGIRIYFGPNWTSTRLVNSSTYEGVHSIGVADFNADGRLDIFAAEMHNRGGHRVTIFEQTSTGSWNEHVISTAGSHNAKIADIDNDGKPDIVGKNYEADDRPRVWYNRTSGGNGGTLPLDQWQRHIVDSSAQLHAVFIDAGDMDKDGDADIISGKYWYKNSGSITGSWSRNTIGSGIDNMAVVYDFDRDGDLDILGNTGRAFAWAENSGSGSFSMHNNIQSVASGGQGDFLQGARAAQIFPGGNPEVIISWHNGDDPPTEGTQMFRVPTPATNTWTWEKISSTTNAEQIAIGDIDGDGDLDIHLGTSWLRQESSGAMTTFSAVSLSTSGADPDRIELTDIDKDGDLDVVIACEHANCLIWGENPSNPTSRWPEHVITTQYLLMSMDVGDMDRDGDIDIAVGQHKGNGKAFVFENKNNGASWTKHTVDAGMSGLDHHDGTQLIDIDEDGDLDIISIGWESRKLVIYENLAGGGPPPPSPTPTTTPGDANGDGKADGIDYVILLNHYGQQTGNGAKDGDFNGDGKADEQDYVIWLQYYES